MDARKFWPGGRPSTSELAAYLLGVGSYAYDHAGEYAEEYRRLHQAVRLLVRQTREDGERVALTLAAQISPVDQVLAALVVAGLRECLATPPGAWNGIPDAVYFEVARSHGRLIEYVSFSGSFAVPATRSNTQLIERYRRFGAYLDGLAEGPVRQGLRLGLLRLFDGDEDDVAIALGLCESLHGRDPLLDELAAQRIAFAIERGEVMNYHPAYLDLGVRMVLTTGRWGIVRALPHLRRLLRETPPEDRWSRVLRANVERAIDQLSPSR